MKKNVSGSIEGLYMNQIPRTSLRLLIDPLNAGARKNRSCRPCRWCLMCVYSPEMPKYIYAADARGVNATQRASSLSERLSTIASLKRHGVTSASSRTSGKYGSRHLAKSDYRQLTDWSNWNPPVRVKTNRETPVTLSPLTLLLSARRVR